MRQGKRFCRAWRLGKGHVLNPAGSGQNAGRGLIEHNKQSPECEAGQTRQEEELETGTEVGADRL